MPKTFDLTKCKEAWEWWEKGYPFKWIGEQMHVSEQRASEMQKTWQYHIELEEAKADLAAFRHFLYERT